MKNFFRLLIVLLFLVIMVSACEAVTPVVFTLTEDRAMGPIEYRGQMYFPSHREDLEDHLDLRDIGSFGYKKESTSITWLELLLGSEKAYVKEKDVEQNQIAITGGQWYTRASLLENNKKIEEHKKYALVEENWLETVGKQAISAGNNQGVALLAHDFIISLDQTFGLVEYKKEDFQSYDHYYSLYASDQEQKLLDPEFMLNNTPQMIGCILEIEGKYYYGSKANEIKGDQLAILLDVIQTKFRK